MNLALRAFSVSQLSARIASIAIFVLSSTAVFAELTDDSGLYGPGALNTINAIVRARAELKAGVLQAVRSNKGSASEEADVLSLYAAFDEPLGLFRYETRGGCRIGVSSSSEALTERTVEHNAGRRSQVAVHESVSLVLQNRNYMLEWYGIGKPGGSSGESATCHIELRDRGTTPTYLASMAFNPSAAGLLDATALNLCDSTEDVFRRFANNATSITQGVDDVGQVQIAYAYPNSVRRIVFINHAEGLTVNRMVLAALDSSQQEMAMPRLETTAKWEESNGTWIPVNYSCVRVKGDGSVVQSTVDISWESINPERLDDNLFDYKTFNDFWPNRYVVERRNGRLEVLEGPNLDDYVVGRGGVSEARQFLPGKGKKSLGQWVVVANAALVVAIGAVIVMKRRRSG